MALYFYLAATMNKQTPLTLSIVIVFVSAVALAQPSGGVFQITKSTIDNGGGRSSGDNFTATGTIAQLDANQQISKGNSFALSGGFWANSMIVDLLFKDNFETE